MKEEKNIPSLSQALQDEKGESAHVIRRVVALGCAVNAVLMTLKLLGGYLGHSDALVADGFHSLNDIMADIIMFIFVGISYRNPDDNYSYGYGKFGTFSSFLMACLLIVIAVLITVEGIETIIDYIHGEVLPQPDIWTFIVILFAMVCKEGLYRFYSRTGRHLDSKALIANAWHHRSDAMASVATLTGVSFAHFFGSPFRVLDPVASIVIAVFIFIPAIKMLWPAFKELMDHSLPREEVSKAKDIISGIPGVEGVKYIRSRRNGHHLVFDIGIFVNPEINVGEASNISEKIKSSFYNSFCPHVVASITTFPTLH